MTHLVQFSVLDDLLVVVTLHANQSFHTKNSCRKVELSVKQFQEFTCLENFEKKGLSNLTILLCEKKFIRNVEISPNSSVKLLRA